MFSPVPASPSRSRSTHSRAIRPARLTLNKAVFFLSLAMLCACLLPQPVHAQMYGMSGGYWQVQDSSGNTLNPNNDGSYTLTGAMTGSAQDNYPGLLDLALSQPFDSRTQYVNAYYPNELSGPFFLYKVAPYNTGNAPLGGGLFLSASAANADIFGYGYNPYIGAFWMPRGTPLDSAPHTSSDMPPSILSVNGSVSANASSALTAVWKWVPYSMMGMGGTSAPPPPYLDLLVSAPVSANVNLNYGNAAPSGGLTGTAMADNGLGDALNVTESSVPSSQSLPGKHLRHLAVNPTTGQVTVTVSGQVTTMANNGVNYGQINYYGTNAFAFGWTNGYTSVSSNANVGATARQDTRAVTISSNLSSPSSPTYYIDPITHLSVANVRQMDGSMTDDEIVPPLTGSWINYHANLSGNWGSNSTYSWSGSLNIAGLTSPLSSSGTFNSTDIFGNTTTLPDISGVYFNPPAMDGQEEMMTLTVKDGVDGATATNTYTVRFHHTHAHPCNFRQVGDGQDIGGGTLMFNYKWDSTSGNLADLKDVIIYEDVSYDGNPVPPGRYVYDQYFPPSPPFNGTSHNNPTTKQVQDVAPIGSWQDQHRPLGFASPDVLSKTSGDYSYTSTQYYKFYCRVCSERGNLAGPITIIHHAWSVPGPVGTDGQPTYKWFYSVSKSGSTATMALN